MYHSLLGIILLHKMLIHLLTYKVSESRILCTFCVLKALLYWFHGMLVWKQVIQQNKAVQWIHCRYCF